MTDLYITSKKIAVSPTITAGAYSAGDVIGGLLTFAVPSAGGGGVWESLLIADDDNEKADVTLYLFDDTPTTIADNAAFAPVMADLRKLCAVKNAPNASYVTVNSNAYYLATNLNFPFQAPNGKLYGYLVATATPTYTAVTDLTIAITVRVD